MNQKQKLDQVTTKLIEDGVLDEWDIKLEQDLNTTRKPNNPGFDAVYVKDDERFLVSQKATTESNSSNRVFSYPKGSEKYGIETNTKFKEYCDLESYKDAPIHQMREFKIKFENLAFLLFWWKGENYRIYWGRMKDIRHRNGRRINFEGDKDILC